MIFCVSGMEDLIASDPDPEEISQYPDQIKSGKLLLFAVIVLIPVKVMTV